MRRDRLATHTVLRAATALALTALVVNAGTSAAGIRGSAHDFSASGTGGVWGSPSESEICIFCHTPHNAQATAPLWNRAVPAQPFTIYGSATLDGQVDQPTQSSRLCLSCHDGAVAIDAYGGGQAAPQMMAIGDVYYPGSPYGEGGPNIGGNYAGNTGVSALDDDHPISLRYDDALAAADGQLRPPSELAGNLPLFANRVECATCHDVHGTLGTAGLLRIDNHGSALCLSCHLK